MANNEVMFNVRLNAKAEDIKGLFYAIARLSEQVDQMQAELTLIKKVLPDMLEVKAAEVK